MPPKPDPRIAEPLTGYAVESAKRAARAPIAPLNAKQTALLREALDDLTELDEYAEELNLTPPAQAAKEAAREFLLMAVREVPRRYAVSLWEEGAVVVYAQGNKGFRVSVYFDADESSSCYVTCPPNKGIGKHHFSLTEENANKRVFDALRSL